MKSVSFYTSFGSRAELLAFIESSGVGKSAVGTWISENMPKEKVFQKTIMDHIACLEKMNYIPKTFMWKQSAAPVMRCGIPDILCVIGGRLFAFEVKRPFGFGELSKIQGKVIDGIRAAGGVAEVVSFAHEVTKIFKREGVLKA